jgi:hypothetical protein
MRTPGSDSLSLLQFREAKMKLNLPLQPVKDVQVQNTADGTVVSFQTTDAKGQQFVSSSTILRTPAKVVVQSRHQVLAADKSIVSDKTTVTTADISPVDNEGRLPVKINGSATTMLVRPYVEAYKGLTNATDLINAYLKLRGMIR